VEPEGANGGGESLNAGEERPCPSWIWALEAAVRSKGDRAGNNGGGDCARWRGNLSGGGMVSNNEEGEKKECWMEEFFFLERWMEEC